MSLEKNKEYIEGNNGEFKERNNEKFDEGLDEGFDDEFNGKISDEFKGKNYEENDLNELAILSFFNDFALIDIGIHDFIREIYFED